MTFIPTPAGSDTELQYNNGGALAGDSALIWDDTNKRVGIGEATPTEQIHVSSSTTDCLIRTDGSSSSAPTIMHSGFIAEISGDTRNGGLFITDGSALNWFVGKPYDGGASDSSFVINNVAGIKALASMVIESTKAVKFPGHTTTGSAANAFLNSSTGELQRSTSSKRYKKKIKNIEVDTAKIYDLRSVSFDSKIEGEDERLFGLIAEEVHTILPDLVEYGYEKDPETEKPIGDARPESVKYQMLSVLLLEELKKLKTRIDILEGA